MVVVPRSKIVILGSCVTRDIFRISSEGVEIVDYYARTCVPSLVSQPIEVDDSEVILDSAFQKRMVLRDIRKSFWSEIGGLEYDLLLLDLVDERFDMVLLGNSYLNKTGELDHSGFLAGKEYTRIQKSAYPSDKWKSDCAIFVQMLRRSVDVRKIAIIRAEWAENYRDKDGQIKQLEGKILQQSQSYNSQIGGYYQELQRRLPECPVLSSKHNLASVSHLWGLAPIHYVDEWYRDLKYQIENLRFSVS